nr:alpha/beta hydrolase [Leucobacter exalbidus]
MIGVIVGCVALAACLVAVLWRGDARGTAAAQPTTSLSGATGATGVHDATGSDASAVTVTNLVVPGPANQVSSSKPSNQDAGAAAASGINRVGSAEVPVRRYDPAPATAATTEPWAVLVWAHGGSFIHGGLDMAEADWAARQFAAAGVRVYSVDYVLASDTVKAPAPANDVAAVASWVARTESAPLLIGGASAGAHLATLAALDRADAALAGDGTAAAALMLEYPTLHRTQRPDAAIARATATLREGLRFDPDRISTMYATHIGEVSDAEAAESELVAGEIAAPRLALLPPTVIVNADIDDLRASGEQFAEQLAVAGVRVLEYTQAGTTHGYLNRPEESAVALASAQQTIDRLVAGARDEVQ